MGTMRALVSILLVALIALPCAPALGQEAAPAAAGESSPDGPGWKVILGWTAVGLGGAALLTGVVFAGLAAQTESEYEEGVELMRTFDELDALHSKGHDYNTVMVAGLVSGLVVAVIGVHMLVWDLAEREAGGVALAPMIDAGGAGLTAVGRF